LIKRRSTGRKTGRKKTRGHPRFEPTADNRTTVETVAGFGLLHRDICLLIVNPHTGKPLSEKTLRANFKAELAIGAVKANANVVKSLYQQATKGNVTAAIWWTKCRMNWKEIVRAEVAGKDGGPIQHHVDVSHLTDAQLAALEEILGAGAAARSGPGRETPPGD